MSKINLIEFYKLRDQNLIYIQKHPEKDLYISKYLPLCTYSSAWNEHTLRARGVVFDSEGNIICNGLTKFFNLEEHAENSIKGEIPWDESFKVYEKKDGSLIQLSFYDGTPIITSSGSFISDHAKKAQELLETKYSLDFEVLKQGHQDKTFIFELISPKFRIVLDYGDEESLCLLAIRDTDTGKEYDICGNLFSDLIFPRPKLYTIDSKEGILNFQKQDIQGEEGVILLFNSGFRVKIKFETYLKLHKLYTQCRVWDIWNILRDGNDVKLSFSTLLKDIPDEFYSLIHEYENELKNKYRNIEEIVKNIYHSIIEKYPKDRKKQAIYIIENYNEYKSILFYLLDGKSYKKLIYDLIEPPKNITIFNF